MSKEPVPGHATGPFRLHDLDFPGSAPAAGHLVSDRVPGGSRALRPRPRGLVSGQAGVILDDLQYPPVVCA